MLSREERETLQEIRNRFRIGKWCLIGFVALGLIGGIPVNDRPLIAFPLALVPLLFASGFLWSISVYSFTRSLARACPRCGAGHGESAHSMWSVMTRRTFWGSRCLSCGLSLRELES